MIYYLSDGTNTLNLDENIQSLSLSSVSRGFRVLDSAGSDNGVLRGFGNYSSRRYIVSRKEKALSGEISTFNNRRDEFIKWFTNPLETEVYFYIDNGSRVIRTRVYCSEIGEESYTFNRISDDRSFELLAPAGYFEDVIAKNGSLAITGTSTQTLTITNDGNIRTSPILSFTPAGNISLFQVNIFDSFGFRLEYINFLAGQKISYDMRTTTLTIDGAQVNLVQYLTSGSRFSINTGDNIINVTCGGPGTFEYEYYERYL